MADKPFIAARLRNPAEDAVAVAPKAKSKTDWIGGVGAIIAFVLAVATVATLYLEWDQLTQFIGY